jgi:flagellar biogenesis protein FliO
MILQFGRMLLALGIVLGLLWLIAKVGQRSQRGPRRRSMGRSPVVDGGRIEMLGRRSMGRHSAIVVVRAAGRTMVVGQTPQQITVLTESLEALRPDEDPGEEDQVPGLASGDGADAPKAWDAFVDRLREMTVRH